MLTISKEFTFDASHYLECQNKSKEWNKSTYGKCSGEYSSYHGHGHTYKLIVTISGEPEESGMIMNFVALKKIVKENIIDKLDHKFLNDVDMFKEKPTTCENMAIVIFKVLEENLKEACILKKITLYETPTSWCIYEK